MQPTKSICVILPGRNTNFRNEDHLAQFKNDTISFKMMYAESGLMDIQNEHDFKHSIPFIVQQVQQAADRGAVGAFIDCFGDPGIHESRMQVQNRISVFGMGEEALRYTRKLGKPFTIISPKEELNSIIHQMVTYYGYGEQLLSIRSVNVPAREMKYENKIEDPLFCKLELECKRAIEEDSADVIVLGCSGMHGRSEPLQQRMRELYSRQIVIIDPLSTAITEMKSRFCK